MNGVETLFYIHRQEEEFTVKMKWVAALILSFVLTNCAFGGEPKPDKGGGKDGRGSKNMPTPAFVLEVPPQFCNVVLGRPTQQSITASVLAYTNQEAQIELGEQPGALNTKLPQQKLAAGIPAEIVIGNLKPNTRYHYKLTSRETPETAKSESITGSFMTQRAKGESFTFTVQADSHLDYNSSPAVYVRAMANVIADGSDFHIDLGDTSMVDKLESRAFAAKQYLAQRYYFSLVGKTMPVFMALGNHDGEAGRFLDGTADNTAVWSNGMRKKYFPNPVVNDFYTGNESNEKLTGPLQDYYAFEWGDAQFIVLDPFWYTPRERGNDDNWVKTLGTTQYNWLKKSMADSKAKFKFIFIHHLVGGSTKQARGGAEAAKGFEWGGRNEDGTDGFKTKRPGWTAPIHQLLVQNNVTAVFHGHDHLFVKQELDGIIYQEVPQPSLARYNNTRSAAEYGYLNGEIQGSSGHVRVKVSPEKVVVDYIRAYALDDENATRKNGESTYTYTIKK